MTDRRFACLAPLALLLPAAAAAQPAGQAADAPPAVVADIGKCRAIAAADARLACFDAAAVRLDAAVEKKELTILDREGVRRTKRSLFGFSLPRIGLFGGGDREEEEAPEFTEINATIQRIIPDRGGLYTFVLDDGAQWRTTEALRTRPKVGDPIRIRKGVLGSYMISVRGTRGAKGVRTG